MKLTCICGHLILNNSDNLAHKAHVIPDQLWPELLESIDSAIENQGQTDKEREAACMVLRKKLSHIRRDAWQCDACGRLYIDDAHGRTKVFELAGNQAAAGIFRRR